jgi:hypothetical protein
MFRGMVPQHMDRMCATITFYDADGRRLPYHHLPLSDFESALCYLDEFWDCPAGAATFTVTADDETKTYDFEDAMILRYMELDWTNGSRS